MKNDHGKYAVAIVGYRGWHDDMSCGDGITAAHNILVSRHETMHAAEAEAARLTAAQKRPIMPGDPSQPIYEARRYAIADYLSEQDRARNGDRPVDRRIVTA